MDEDDRLAPDTVARRVSAEAGCVDDGEVGRESGELLRGRHSEQVAAEDAGPGRLGIRPDRSPPAGMRPDIAVADEQLAARQVVDHPLAQRVVSLLADGPVEATPPDPLVRIPDIDEVLVQGRSTGVLSGAHQQRAPVCDEPLRCADGVLVEFRHGEVRVARVTQLGQRRRRSSARRGHRRPPAGATCRSHLSAGPAARETPGEECRSRLPQSDNGCGSVAFVAIRLRPRALGGCYTTRHGVRGASASRSSLVGKVLQ